MEVKRFSVAPITSTTKPYPTRVNCTFKETSGQIVLDQIRTIDRKRIVKILDTIDKKSQGKTIAVLAAMFGN